MLEGWQIKNSRHWEHTRVIAYNILAVNRDPKKRFPSIQEYMPLPTDVVVNEDAEADRMQKKMDEYKEKLKQQ